MTLVEAFSSFDVLRPVGEPPAFLATLPSRYVAAKFYGNSALPDTGENRRFIADMLAQLTEHVDVVLLNTGHRFDDHDDFAAELFGYGTQAGIELLELFRTTTHGPNGHR